MQQENIESGLVFDDEYFDKYLYFSVSFLYYCLFPPTVLAMKEHVMNNLEYTDKGILALTVITSRGVPFALLPAGAC